MKALLRGSLGYYAGKDQWTPNIEDAFDFCSSWQALSFTYVNRLAITEVILDLSYESRNHFMDVVIPLSQKCDTLCLPEQIKSPYGLKHGDGIVNGQLTS
jgi:hypothetical protein